MTTDRSATLQPARRRDVLIQLAFVTLIVASFIWVGRDAFPGSTVIFAASLLVALVWSHWNRRDSLRELGFRLDTAPRTALILAPVAICAITLTIAAGMWMGTLRFPSPDVAISMLAKLLLFGIFQQSVLLGFYYRGLTSIVRTPWSALLLTALVFAMLHLPNPFLMTVTFLAAGIAAAIYRRSPNLWVNGLNHGLISFVLYYSLPNTVTGGLRVGPEY